MNIDEKDVNDECETLVLDLLFTSIEKIALEKEKEKYKVSWHDFILYRCLKIRMKGEKVYRIKDLK
jgi:hypothetical protein